MLYLPNPFKRCPKCGKWKLATLVYFRKQKAHTDGLRSECKACGRAAGRSYYQENRLVLAERHRARYLTLRSDNPEILRARSRSSGRAYRQAHPDKVREENRRYERLNRDKRREYQRRWRTTNPERANEKNHRYRARKRTLPSTMTKADWQRCVDYFGGRCAYCGASGKITRDHVIPITSPDCPGDVPANVVPTCASCNKGKCDSDLTAWLTRKFGEQHAVTVQAALAQYVSWLADQAVHSSH